MKKKTGTDKTINRSLDQQLLQVILILILTVAPINSIAYEHKPNQQSSVSVLQNWITQKKQHSLVSSYKSFILSEINKNAIITSTTNNTPYLIPTDKKSLHQISKQTLDIFQQLTEKDLFSSSVGKELLAYYLAKNPGKYSLSTAKKLQQLPTLKFSQVSQVLPSESKNESLLLEIAKIILPRTELVVFSDINISNKAFALYEIIAGVTNPKHNNISIQQLENLIIFIETEKHNILNILNKIGKKSLYMNTENFGTPIPIQIYSDGTIYLHLQNEIARGGFKKVLLSIDYLKMEKVANLIALGTIANQTPITNIEKELTIINILRQHNTPGIVEIKHYDYYRGKHDGEKYLAVQEELYDSDLQGFINKNLALNECKRIKIAKQLTRSLIKIHQRGILHQDIKPSNILIKKGIEESQNQNQDTEDSSPVVAFTDFGSASTINFPQTPTLANKFNSGMNGVVGTPGYIPPEQIFKNANKPSTDLQKGDIYSLGITFHQLINKKFPPIFYHGRKWYKNFSFGKHNIKHDFQTYLKMKNRQRKQRKIISGVDPKAMGMLQTILNQMISLRVESRPELSNVLKTLESLESLNCP
ncbi:MAG: protein kinase [Oligoflexia bacterium]|nr:protein kinase [Oligoflexia bacterium]